MRIQTKLSTAFMCATSLVAISTSAIAQDGGDGGPETVVVTGSRVISDATNSPTPLTIVTTAQLAITTPSDIQDGLNKLPTFLSSSTPANNTNASNNNAGNVLGLRTLGAQRTLILFDGHRVAPSNQNGTVDTDVLPQMLMTRVDVVTGGTSAVYGSDAVAGVVNFVIDKHFEGVKYNVSGGISDYGDGAQYQVGVAAGTDLFGGAVHIEGSLRHFSSDPVQISARPLGPDVFELSGGGTAAAPFTVVENARLSNFSFGGKITCTGTAAVPCAANGQQFIGNGVIGPFNAGTPTLSSGLAIGGDGANTTVGTLIDSLKQDESFVRASYNIDDTTQFYIQGSASQSKDDGHFQNNYIQTGTVPNTFYTNNPYLPASAQALLAGSSTGTFQIAKYINNLGPEQGFQTYGQDRYLSFTTGLDGTAFGKYNWDVFYTHGDSRVKVDDPNNQNNQKMYAAEDAVNNSAGSIVCYVSTTSSAGSYPGCVPMNPFGPTALTPGQYQYFTQDTHFVLEQTLDDFGGSVSGQVYDLPAGPVTTAFSGEYRIGSYALASNASPSQTINCTNLRLCNSSTAYWQANIANSQPYVSNNVWEIALESEVPLLKDIPLVESLSANLAGRYTDYSASGPVQTWKVGLVYHVNDDISFRGTNSIDIRAPNLNDLYSPVQVTHSGFTDLHTGNTAGTTLIQTQGNPNLVPEVARTYTGGVVFTPTFIPNLTMSLDFYSIKFKNAISSLSGNSTTNQQLCETAGGTGIYRALYIRPLPFSNTTPANYPTAVLSESLNSALSVISGWDYEVNYHFDLADVAEALPGSFDLRMLANYQPVNESQTTPAVAIQAAATAKSRFTMFANYNIESWTLGFEDRWVSSSPASTTGQIYIVPRIHSTNAFDFSATKKVTFADTTAQIYASVQNVFNTQWVIAPNNTANPGLVYPTQGGNNMGRYFTIGIRGSF